MGNPCKDFQGQYRIGKTEWIRRLHPVKLARQPQVAEIRSVCRGDQKRMHHGITDISIRLRFNEIVNRCKWSQRTLIIHTPGMCPFVRSGVGRSPPESWQVYKEGDQRKPGIGLERFKLHSFFAAAWSTGPIQRSKNPKADRCLLIL